MFSFFRKKTPPSATDGGAVPNEAPSAALPTVVSPVDTPLAAHATTPAAGAAPETSGLASTFASIKNWFAGGTDDVVDTPVPVDAPPPPVARPDPVLPIAPTRSPVSPPALPPAASPIQPQRPAATPLAPPVTFNPPVAAPAQPVAAPPAFRAPVTPPILARPIAAPSFVPVAPAPGTTNAPPPSPEPERRHWLDKLRGGLRKTGTSIAQVFTGTQIDDALYEELESALLMADAGVKATEYLLVDLKQRVKESRADSPQAVRSLLVSALAELLLPLEAGLVIGEHTPTVIMVVGVNGAGKTTSIGKLTRHLAEHGETVLLAAADTFRAAAKEQLAVWAGRNNVEIVSQEGGDPSAVTFDAVVAGAARGRDVVIADTAGRLPTQTHLMDELKKIKRTIGKAQGGAPHEILLVVDGNTGQNALAQVKSFDDALGLTGLVITKLDGTAKGGVLAAIALWSRERARVSETHKPVPVYFVGVGEKLEDLETFDAREFAMALLT